MEPTFRSTGCCGGASTGAAPLTGLLLEGVASGAALAATLAAPLAAPLAAFAPFATLAPFATRAPLAGPGLRELANKVAAYRAFRVGGARRSGDPPAGEPAEPWQALWEEEGAGYGAAVRWGRAGRWDRLAAFADAADPARRLPRHTGLGLGLATLALEAAPGPPAEVVDRFLEALERTGRPDHREAAVENLGLAVRMLRPEDLPAWGRWLATRDGRGTGRDGALAELFWHGAGRGLYFAPTEAWRSGSVPWPALDRALAEAPDGAARRNAAAGLAWALALVNVRHPEVVAWRVGGVAAERRPAVVHGVASALALWRACTGETSTPERFLAAEVGERGWTEGVVPAVRWALDGPLRGLQEGGGLAATFRCGDGEGWA